MRKWIGLVLSLLLGGIFILHPVISGILNPVADTENIGNPGTVFAQGTEKDARGDTYSVTLLKQIREQVETWLKSLNEKIENEEITGFEVRFYEILRSILEWVKEKIDAKIGSPEGEIPPKREKGGPLRQTRQKGFSSFRIG